MGGGDDGNNEAQIRQGQNEAAKQQARDAINRIFSGQVQKTGQRYASTNPLNGGTLTEADYASKSDEYKALQEKRAKDPTYAAPQQTYGQPVAQQGTWLWGGNEGNVYDIRPGVSAPASTEFDPGQWTKQEYQYWADGDPTQTREALYQGVRDNAFTAGKRGLDEAAEEAGRKTKFELFARGLDGGSEDVDQNAMLGRKYSQGLLDLGAKADSAKAQFRGDDEQTRLSLLQSIDAGMDAGSASSSALNQMRVNADRAAADASGTALGDLFSSGSHIYNKSQMAQGRQAGTEWWNQFSPSSSRGSKSANGSKTSLPGE